MNPQNFDFPQGDGLLCGSSTRSDNSLPCGQGKCASSAPPPPPRPNMPPLKRPIPYPPPTPRCPHLRWPHLKSVEPCRCLECHPHPPGVHTCDGHALRVWNSAGVSSAYTLPFMVESTRSRRPLPSRSSARTMLCRGGEEGGRCRRVRSSASAMLQGRGHSARGNLPLVPLYSSLGRLLNC